MTAFIRSDGEMLSKLTALSKALSSVQPTSVESERVFCTVGQFVTKIRSRLSDKKVKSLFLLKSHYKPSKLAKSVEYIFCVIFSAAHLVQISMRMILP